MKQESKHGGYREGAGRKPNVTFKEPSSTYSVRVPKSLLNELGEKYGKSLNNKVKDFLTKLNQTD